MSYHVSNYVRTSGGSPTSNSDVSVKPTSGSQSAQTVIKSMKIFQERHFMSFLPSWSLEHLSQWNIKDSAHSQDFSGQLLLIQIPMATDLLASSANDSPDSLIGHVIISGNLTQRLMLCSPEHTLPLGGGGEIFHWVFAGSLAGCLRGFPATTLGLVRAASNGLAEGSLLGSAK